MSMIEITATGDTTLYTEGKYCEEDILVKVPGYVHPPTHPASMITGLAAVATSGSYYDLTETLTVDSVMSSSSTNPVQNKVINSALAGKAPTTHTHTKSQITDFPTSLPASDVSSWAKASTKPSYTASEVGAYTKNEVDNKLSAKQATITGAATSITAYDLAENKALVSSSTGKVVDSITTAAEIGFLSGVKNNVQTQLDGKVPTTRTVNNKALSSNITLSASDVSAVPTSRTINGKALSSNITLAASDVSAAPAYTYGTTDLTAGSSSLTTGVLYFVYE